MEEQAKRTRAPRWMQILLAISLALNLGVAGMAAGSFLRTAGPARDLGLGPLGDALSREDRRALRRAFVALHPELGRGAAALRGDFDPLLAALRADPFDPAALDAALEGIVMHNVGRMRSSRDLIAERLKAMTPQSRAAFAARLETIVARAAARVDKRWRKPG